MARQWGPTGKGKGCEIESCWKYLTIINGHVNLQYESAVKLDLALDERGERGMEASPVGNNRTQA